MQLAIDSTELGTFDFEPQTGLLVWSEFAQHHFGVPANGKADCNSFLRAIHPEDRPRMERVFKELFQYQNGGQFCADYRIVGVTDGKLRWISMRGRMFFDPERRPARFVGVMIDTTQHKQLEQERQELMAEFQRQRSLLAAILNQMPDGVIVAEALSGQIL